MSDRHAAPLPFRADTRAHRLEELAGERFDLLVVGAGLTGAAIARDAAMRGLHTALVDKADLGGSGAASAPLLLPGPALRLHRPLTTAGRGAAEQARLQRLAPHLVRPVPCLQPLYDGAPPSMTAARAGSWARELAAPLRGLPGRRVLRGLRAADREPSLRTEGLRGGVLSWARLLDAPRLALATARAAHDAGAWVLPYLEVEEFLLHRSQVAGAALADRRGDARVELHARAVVNATGAWTDRTRGLRGPRSALLGVPHKVVSAVVDRAVLPLEVALWARVPELPGGLIALPVGRRVVLTAPGFAYGGDFDRVPLEAEELASLLGAADRLFPEARLRPDRLVTAGAELALPPPPSGGHVLRDEDGLITVTGVDPSMHRLVAAQVVDGLAALLRELGLHLGGCNTGSVRLPGGRGIAEGPGGLVTVGPEAEQIDKDGDERLGPEVTAHLRQAHGGRWLEPAALAHEEEALAGRVVPDLPWIWAELEHALQEELLIAPADFLLRRTSLGRFDPDLALPAATVVADRLGEVMGWNPARRAMEVAAYRKQAPHPSGELA